MAWSAARHARRKLLDRINDEVFSLGALRPMAAADLQAAADADLDFDRLLPTSLLQQYVARLRHYLESHGAIFHDDWGDPDQPLAVYADGDHVTRAFRRTYTDMLVGKNPEIFR